MQHHNCSTNLYLVTLHAGIILVLRGVSNDTGKAELNKNRFTPHPHMHAKFMQNT